MWASGKACTTPWSVIAIDFIPHFIALFIKSFADVIASIWLIFVCICNSTLFTSLLSCLTVFFNPSLSTIVFAITVSSLENESIWAFPEIFTPFAFFILFVTFLLTSLFKNALQVILLEPSYKSKLKSVFPDFNSLSSIPIISPSSATFPSSTFNSEIFTTFSVIFGFIPKINGVSSSSSGSSGTSLLLAIIVFAIIVTSPAYASSPAFPIAFIAFAFWILSITSFPSEISFAKDLQVIVPVPSYISNINIPFPVLVSLHSLVNILPSIVILELLAVISLIFTLFSFALDGFPIIYSCSSYSLISSGIGGSPPSISSSGIYPSNPVGGI